MSIPLKELTPVEIRRAGWEALREKLWPASAIKFILDYDRGEGDYTKLRQEMFSGKMVKAIIEDIKEKGFL